MEYEMSSTGNPMIALLAIPVGLAVYIFFSYCAKLICEKSGKQPGVLIWIPIVQLIPLMEVAGMATWMIVLALIPLANIVFIVLLGLGLCKARKKNPALVVLLFLPCLNFVFLPYLAFSE